MDLLEYMNEMNREKESPLASRLRPTTLDEVVGQEHIIGKDKLLYRAIKADKLSSILLYGPPGTGKTTLAKVIAATTKAEFLQINATSAGKKDMEEVVAKAKENRGMYGKKTILFIDEIHRYSKTQQDALLPHLENGTLFLIGSTTENPSFQVVPALLSRLQVIRLNSIDDESMKTIIKKGFAYLAKNYTAMDCESGVLDFIVNLARGDARYALNVVENAYFASDLKDNRRNLTVSIIEEICQKRNTRYSQQEHYDCASAFQKSLRGSDPDAAIYYLAKMIADPNAMNIAVNAYKAVELLGLPEGRIPLALAVIYVAKAPKNNKAICAIDAALADIEHGKDFPPPMHLRDAHYKDAKNYGFGIGYVYSHDAPDVYQQFLPDEIKDRKYL